MRNQQSRKWWAILALTLIVMTVGLDMTVLNLALPTLATALHATSGQLEWFVDAYNLVLAAALLPLGLLGDRFGRKKILLISLLLFGAGSLFCAYASSAGTLITARVVLGLGAAALMPLSMSILPVLFNDEERPKAVALLMVGNMIAFPIGPILGGWLLSNFWWGSVFLINLPVVVIAMVAVILLLPESKSENRPALDLIGILTSSAGLVSFTYGVITGGEKGWGSNEAWITLGLGFLLLVGFVLWERRTSHPLIDLSLFRSPGFLWGSNLATLVSFAMFGVLFTVPQYFQNVIGTDALGSGLRLLPLIVGLFLSAPIAAKLAGRIGVKVSVTLGFAILAGGLMIGTGTSLQSGTEYAALWLAVIGLGLGCAMPSTMDAALGSLTAEKSGVGSALIMALRQVGSTVGVAVLGSVLSANYQHQLPVTHLPAPVAKLVQQNVAAGVAIAHRLGSQTLLQSIRGAFVHGMSVMLWVCAGIAWVGVILALVFLPSRHGSKGGAEQI